MKLAGLNPMLAYSQGGASTPTGAAAQSSGYEARNVLGETATAALGAYKNIQEVAQMQQQTKQIEAQTEATKEQTLNTSADTANKIAHNPNISIEGKKLVSQITLNNELAKTQTTAQGLNRATTKNVQENIAPSGDPYWYRDAKNIFSSAKDAWQQKIKPYIGKIKTRNCYAYIPANSAVFVGNDFFISLTFYLR